VGSIKINQVSYFGNKYSYVSPKFDKAISIVEGPNGSGKSTLFNLIYFALGGKVDEFTKGNSEEHKEIVYDTNNFVELDVELSGRSFNLIRDFKENKVKILSEETFLINGEEYPKAASLPINRNNSASYIFSDWLLDKLGIPVMELFSAGKSFKLGFYDLARLFYHSQEPDRTKIYKPNDKNSFVSDSVQVRNAIFEILVGKNLRDLYAAIGDTKGKQSDYDTKRTILNEYKSIVSEILAQNGFNEVINEHHLRQKIEENKKEIERLNALKQEHYSSKKVTPNGIELIDSDKRQLISLDKILKQEERKGKELLNEKWDIKRVYDKTIEDISRIEKILHTHKQLSLFSSDTCPYCLTTVQRSKNKCICGSDIEEGQYQRYFYEPSEYYDLLSSKIKSLETIKLAMSDIEEDFKDNNIIISDLLEKISVLEQRISHRIEHIEEISNHDVVEQLDEKIFDLKSIVNDLEQALKLEIKLSRHQNNVSVAKTSLDKAKVHEQRMQAIAANELLERISEFNEIYNNYMINCLIGCRNAEIESGNYIPSVNDGEYKELSAKVPRRFFYYLTLLKLSLNKDIPFPRFLLIDTPEAHGIDLDNLNKMLSTVGDLNGMEGFQILLSTGEGKYPAELKENVVIRLSKESRLLKLKN
jgi:energy-coupling factor transporter ATP-binding protein EcfA2